MLRKIIIYSTLVPQLRFERLQLLRVESVKSTTGISSAEVDIDGLRERDDFGFHFVSGEGSL